MNDARILLPRMRMLIRGGRATPLLVGHFPAPVALAGRWWHIPVGAADDNGFVLADAEQTQRYDQLAQRIARAQAPCPPEALP